MCQYRNAFKKKIQHVHTCAELVFTHTVLYMHMRVTPIIQPMSKRTHWQANFDRNSKGWLLIVSKWKPYPDTFLAGFRGWQQCVTRTEKYLEWPLTRALVCTTREEAQLLGSHMLIWPTALKGGLSHVLVRLPTHRNACLCPTIVWHGTPLTCDIAQSFPACKCVGFCWIQAV